MDSQKIMDEIQKTITGATQPAQSRFLACSECSSCHVWQTNQPLPTTCPAAARWPP